VTLALIGPTWLTPVGDPPLRRLDDPNDWVRAEIAIALRQGRLVVPVLAPGAPALATANLPPDLEALARFTPLPLRPDPVFDADVRELTRMIRPYAGQGPASWTLLIGGVFLALVYLSMIPLSYNPVGYEAVFVEAGWVAQIGLGAYAIWRALVRREWGWLAAGALTLLAGLMQFAAQDLPAATVTSMYTVIELVASPLAAGLCLLAGAFGPRLPRAPDTLRQRWTGWHIALAILLALTTALLALNWLLLATEFGGDQNVQALIGVAYFTVVLVTALMTVATGIVATARAITYRRVWWGIGALALTASAGLAEILLVLVSTMASLIASVLLPVAFLVYGLAWLTSYAARTPAPVRSTAPRMERAP
jgi:hypothetical protein